MIESFLTLNMIELASWPCFSVPLLVFTLLSVHIYLLSSAEGHYNHFHSVRCCKNISQYVSPSYNQLLKCVKLSAFIMHSRKHECMYRGHAPVCVCVCTLHTHVHTWVDMHQQRELHHEMCANTFVFAKSPCGWCVQTVWRVCAATSEMWGIKLQKREGEKIYPTTPPLTRTPYITTMWLVHLLWRM